MYSFIETKLFTRLSSELLSDDEMRKLQMALIADPLAGDLIPGTGGVRKLRWRAPGRGKRGGYRVIYFARLAQGHILDADDLSEECSGEHTGARPAPNPQGD